MLKKICVIFVVLFMATCCCMGEEMPEWTEQTDYLYGLYITDMEGGALPPAPMDVSVLENGIRIEIINGMPYADRFSLVAILNGHVQPFYIEGEPVDYLTSEIEGDGHLFFDVAFRDFYVSDVGVQYLHLLCVGILDRVPKSEWDAISNYSVAVTLPFQTQEAANVAIPFQSPQMTLPEEVTKNYCDYYCMLDFYDRIEGNSIYFPPCIQETEDNSAEFTLIATGDCQMMQVVTFFDGAPCANEDRTIPCFWLARGNAWQFSFSLPAQGEGSHQAFAVALPLFGTSGVIPATPKIQFYCTQ